MNAQLSLITYAPDGTILYAINKVDRSSSHLETDFDRALSEGTFSGELPSDFNINRCYMYSLKDGDLVPSKFENYTLEQCELLNSKFLAIDLLIKVIVIKRRQLFNNDIFLQDHMYTVKYDQALAYKATGYDVTKLSDYPVVVVDTEVNNVSGQDAADRIIKVYEYFDKALINIEVARVKNRHAIWNSTTTEQIETIKQSFLTQG